MTAAYNVLFLCTGNSARSILAEAILNHLGAPRFAAFSAGTSPKGVVHPDALTVLRDHGLPTGGLRSKGWEAFAAPGAPRLDFIFTLCDSAAKEPCPIWPGKPVSAHWSAPDPSLTGAAQAWRDVYRLLQSRIMVFCALPIEAIGAAALQDKLSKIGAR